MAEMIVLERTKSPNGRYALATDDSRDRTERIWRVSLPSRAPIGEPYIVDGFIGLQSRSHAVWNRKAALVALAQGGIPYEETEVFQYSSKGLHELPLPRLAEIPRGWYLNAVINRCYVEPVRWIGSDRLEMIVGGSLSYGENNRRYFGYCLHLNLKFRKHGHTIIVSISDDPLEAL